MTQLADALVDQGVEVHLVTWAGSATGDFYPVDPRVHRHKLNSDTARPGLVRRLTRGLSVIVYLRALMRRIAPDCVLSFIDQSNVLTLAAATGLPVRVVVAERIDPRANDTLGRGWALARLLTYPRAQLVVAQTDAVAAFRTRAQQLTQAFGFNGYRLREVNVQTHGGQAPRVRMAQAAMLMDAKAEAQPMPVEAGTAEVVVEVSGSVQME